MRLKLLFAALLFSVSVSLLFVGQRSSVFEAAAQTPTLETPTPQTKVKSKAPQVKTPPPSNAQTVPVSDANRRTPPSVASSAQTPRPARGFFRVTLNGFRVNHESDDDILEGDGRGDEIFITSNIWSVQRDGTYLAFAPSRTKVMGDPNNHPERVAAGSGHPGPTSLNVMIGGLHTGDVFPGNPTNEPWRRAREPLTDRPPVVLWNGFLTQGQDMIVIAPIIWEWDSDDVSVSQTDVASGLPRWFERVEPILRSRIADWHLGNRVAFGPYSLHLNGKAGTRPIGYREAGTSPGPTTTTDESYDYLGVVGLYLSYDSAIQAAERLDERIDPGVRGLYELRYIDASDNGDYTLYLQVERLDSH